VHYAREIRRGAWVNAVGLVAKAALPLSYLVLTRLFGSELFGQYLLAFFIANLFGSALGTGFMNAVTIFAAPAAGDGDEAGLLDVTASALRASLGLGLGFAVLAWFVAGPFCAAIYPELHGLRTGLILLSFGMVPEMLTRVAVGLGKAHLQMRWDPLLLGLAGPTLQVLLGLGAWDMDLGLSGLFWSMFLSQTLVGVGSLMLLGRFLPLRALWSAGLSRRSGQAGLLSFGLVQSANMGVTRYASRVDVMMLGAMGMPAWQLGWYATAAMITSEIRQLRIIFAAIATPLVARAKQAGEMYALGTTLARLSRASTLLAFPTVMLAIVVLGSVLTLFDPHYTHAPFLLVLLVTPTLSCAYGLSGNFLVATGHNRMNLMNATITAVLNTGLNALLIPSHGLLGAAAATATAQAVQVALENTELWKLERVRLPVSGLLRPLVLFAPPFVLLVQTHSSDSMAGRALIATAALLLALVAHAASGLFKRQPTGGLS